MQENTDNSASPAASPRTKDGHFQKGQSGNPSGRPKQNHALIEALEAAVDKDALAAKVVSLAMAGDVTMIKYIYDRLAGQPVQRHEAKLEYEVKERARALAKQYGLSEEEVMRQAEDIVRGG